MSDYFIKKNILGEMTVQISTTARSWNRLLETGLWNEVTKILGSTEGTENVQKEPRTESRTNYQDMTENERNELIAYTAGMGARSNDNIERLRKMQSFLLAISILDLILILVILSAILLHR